MKNITENKRQTLEGIVISRSGDKSIVVLVDRYVQHPKYKKYYRKSKKYAVHDENNDCEVGDRVTIMSSRPFSKRKRFALLQKKTA